MTTRLLSKRGLPALRRLTKQELRLDGDAGHEVRPSFLPQSYAHLIYEP